MTSITKIYLGITISLFSFVINFDSIHEENFEEFDVAEFYEYVTPKTGTKFITSNDEVYDAEEILAPTKIDVGKYSVQLTRKAQDIYSIDGTSLYIETRYCYEYTYGNEAILVVESNGGYSKGKVIFTN